MTWYAEMLMFRFHFCSFALPLSPYLPIFHRLLLLPSSFAVSHLHPPLPPPFPSTAPRSAPTKPLKRKAPYIAPKPTKEQIAERQALKALKREAEALAAKKEVVPKDVVELKKEGKVDEHGEKMTPSKKEGNEGKGKREMTTKSASTPSKPTPTPKSATKPKPSTPQPSTPSSTSSKRKRPSSAEQPTTPAAAAAGSAKKQQQGGGSAKKDVGGAAGGGSVKKVKKVKVDA